MSGLSPPSKPLPRPFPFPSTVDPWIQQTLVHDILHDDLTPLDNSINNAVNAGIPQMKEWGVTDSHNFLLFASGMLVWAPNEIASGKLIYWTMCLFYFILDQTPLGQEPYSTKIEPYAKTDILSAWVVSYAKRVGAYMDQAGSISKKSIESFVNSPLYHYDEAAYPVGGWKTFNQLFSRFLKPGMRPISCPDDDSVVVYPADSTFDGVWPVEANDTVSIASSDPAVNVKYIPWPISELLNGSQYADKFAGGQFMHAFLNTFDYHRQHAPVGGTVVEANVIEGLAYLNVVADEEGNLIPHRGLEKLKPGLGGSLDAPDNAGYQFLQARGCVIIKNPLLGYVAVLPIGMAQVSSVKLVWTPDEGQCYPIYPNAQVKKGEEISHFEFGGSDIVLVFQKDANLKILGATGLDANGQVTTKQKYLMGMPLGVSSN